MGSTLGCKEMLANWSVAFSPCFITSCSQPGARVLHASMQLLPLSTAFCAGTTTSEQDRSPICSRTACITPRSSARSLALVTRVVQLWHPSSSNFCAEPKSRSHQDWPVSSGSPLSIWTSKGPQPNTSPPSPRPSSKTRCNPGRSGLPSTLLSFSRRPARNGGSDSMKTSWRRMLSATVPRRGHKWPRGYCLPQACFRSASRREASEPAEAGT
mmetsp:Transcript_47986/g.108741  ORF Transcript_47986/g.108741 Transcript_47986/m.108741 type:complete len:213 (+) Transcript_47986:266-904(+)